MPYPHRFILIFLGICIALQSFAKVSSDTTVKKLNVPLTHSNNLQSINNFHGLDGFRAIRADSMKKGIHLLAADLKLAFATFKRNRVMNYNALELITLIENLDSDTLSLSEKELGFSVIRMVFKDTIMPTEKNLDVYFKKAPNTLFVERVRLMIHANDGDNSLPSLLKSMLKKHPEIPSLNILQAELYFEHDKFEAAIPYCDKAISLWPVYAYAYNLRARCEGRLRQYEKEAKDEDLALSYFSEYPDAYYYRAGAYEDMEKYRPAIDNYLQVNRRTLNYEYTDYSLSRCYKLVDMPDSALFYINRYIRHNLNDADGYQLKGNIYYRRDDYPAAIECYNQAVILQPEIAGIYEDRGDAYFYWGKQDTAIADFTKAAKLDKEAPYPVERIGDCYYKMKDYDKSITYHQKALSIDPKYKYAWVSLENCYNQVGKHELGLEACKRAISIDSTYDLAIGNLGWEYYCTGHFDECITWSYKCLKYNEEATYAMFNIALATLRKGEFEKAKELYVHFLDLCKEKKYELTGGAQDDLRDLIKKNILRDQASDILKDIFKEEP